MPLYRVIGESKHPQILGLGVVAEMSDYAAAKALATEHRGYVEVQDGHEWCSFHCSDGCPCARPKFTRCKE